MGLLAAIFFSARQTTTEDFRALVCQEIDKGLPWRIPKDSASLFLSPTSRPRTHRGIQLISCVITVNVITCGLIWQY